MSGEVAPRSAPVTGSVSVLVAGAPSVAAGAGAPPSEPLVTNTPLAGVTVELWPGHGEEPPLIGRRRTQETDEDGRARFGGLEPGPYTVDVIARPTDPLGGAQQPRFVEVRAGDEVRLEVALTIAMLAKGRVVDGAGAPVAGADIWAGDDILEQQALPQHLLRRVAKSRPDGTFTAPLAPHEERLAARKEGYADSTSLAVAVLGGAEVEWRLVLSRELARVRGTVRDARNAPIAGIALALQRSGAALTRRADGLFEQGHLPLLLHTDERGDFATDLAPGEYRCRAIGANGSAAASFSVVAGETAFVELVFPDGVAVRGVVRTSAGAPVPSLPIWIEVTALDGALSYRIARTLSDGSFLFLGVPREPFVVEAGRPSGRLRARSEQSAPTGSIVDCELLFDDPPPLRGRVVRPNGRSVAGLVVQVWSTSDEYLTGATCDDAGEFTLNELVAGPYRLVITHTLVPGGRALFERETVLDPDSVVELRLPNERGALRGRAIDERGAPVSGVALSLAAPDESPYTTLSAEDGRFSFSEVPPVRSTLRARGAGRAFLTQSVNIADDKVTDIGDVVVPQEAGLEVQVFHADGTPWRDAPPVPWIYRAGALVAGRDRIEYTLNDGKVRVHGLESGTYRLQPAAGDSLTFAPRTLELIGGTLTHVDVHVQAGRAITLELEAPPAGSAPNGIELTVRDARGNEALRQHIAPPSFLSSRWRVEHTFPPGNYTAEATVADGLHWRLEFEVRLEGELASPLVVPRR